MNTGDMAKYREMPEQECSLRVEVVECLVEGLQFLKGDAAMPAQQLAKRILANIIVEHLEICGFSVQRRPAAAAPPAEEHRAMSVI